MTLGDRVWVFGYVDEIRKDVIIIRNDSGYFGTEKHNVYVAESVKEREAKNKLIRCKDCAYRQEDGFCPITDCYDFDDEDFCSKAERKEE